MFKGARCITPIDAAMSSESFSNAWLSDEFVADYGQITVLIDEDRDRRCAYAVCSMFRDERQGKPRVLQFGQDSTADVVEFARVMVDKHDARVVCDAVPGGELQAIARHFRWAVSMPKSNEFPSIGFICGLGR